MKRQREEEAEKCNGKGSKLPKASVPAPASRPNDRLRNVTLPEGNLRSPKVCKNFVQVLSRLTTLLQVSLVY